MQRKCFLPAVPSSFFLLTSSFFFLLSSVFFLLSFKGRLGDEFLIRFSLGDNGDGGGLNQGGNGGDGGGVGSDSGGGGQALVYIDPERHIRHMRRGSGNGNDNGGGGGDMMTYTVWSSSVLSPACDGTQWGDRNDGDSDGDGGDGGDGRDGVSEEDNGEDDEEDGVLIRGCRQRTARFNAKVKPHSLNISNIRRQI